MVVMWRCAELSGKSMNNGTMHLRKKWDNFKKFRD